MKKLISVVLFYLNIIAGIALLLSYLSTFVPPAKIWILAFFGLAYPYFLLINILFLIYYIFRGKINFLFSLIIILIGISHLNNFIPLRIGKKFKGSHEEIAKNKIIILSFNVRAFNVFEWYANPETSQSIINLIQSENPDIICLQEYYARPGSNYKPEKVSSLFRNTPYHYIHYYLKNNTNTGYGIAIFSRFPVVGEGTISFKNTSNETIFVDLNAFGDTFRIYNNHLQSVKFQKKNYDFLDSLKLNYGEEDLREIKDISRKLKTAFEMRSVQVDSISKHISKCPYPVVVCGDFNDTPVSYSYRKMKTGLKDAFITAGVGIGNTYAAIFPSFRIDYILHSPEFRPLIFEKVEAKLSDHYPILCTFDYKKETVEKTK